MNTLSHGSGMAHADRFLQCMKRKKCLEKTMIDKVRAKKIVDELDKSCPMLDYQKELMINILINERPDYSSYILKMQKLNFLYLQYVKNVCESLLFNRKGDK